VKVVIGVTALWARRKHDRGWWAQRERAMKIAIIVAVLGVSLAASVFVEVSIYKEVVSIADASIDAGPTF
jgi:hypothetical protein